MTRAIKFYLSAALAAFCAACGPSYSPDSYNPDAMQQASKVETGIVIGFRQVTIDANGTVGAVAGGAAGGILGSTTGSTTVSSALGAVGGTMVGGIVGSTVEQVAGKATGWEYIVREDKGDLVSVTQREPTPLLIGQKVLVIAGKQARIVPNYANIAPSEPVHPKAEVKETPKPAPVVAVPVPTPPPAPQAGPAAEPAMAGAAVSVSTIVTTPPPPAASPAEPPTSMPSPAAPDAPAANGDSGNAHGS